MDYQLITDSAALRNFCQQAVTCDYIAVDTEFVRTRTLTPQIGLVQIYDGRALVLIDPLSIDDLSPLAALLQHPTVVKVLHSCSEDIETFIAALDIVPQPIYDTQFAAGLQNMGNSLGYAALVEKMLSVSIDKGESRTDWLARPLSQQQLGYAANDVLYLYQLYPQLRAASDKRCQSDWVTQELSALSNKKRAKLATEYAYLSFKNNWKLQGRSLYCLKMLGKWRAELAKAQDKALNFVVKEQNLFEVARLLPNGKQALREIHTLHPMEIRKHGDDLLALVALAKNASEADFPPPVERVTHFSGYKSSMAAIRECCLRVAEQQNIPVEILGSKKQAHQLLKWLWFDMDETRLSGLRPDLISGWRAALLADPLLKALNICADYDQSGNGQLGDEC